MTEASKDTMLRGVLSGRNAKFTAISGKGIVEKARELHSLSRVCTAALGRALIMTSMMGIALKGADERVSTIIKGEGMAGNVVCTAFPNGNVKGYIENPSLELPPTPGGKLDVALAVGWFGSLTVIRDMGLKEPYVGNCPMVSGEIAEDFANYFTVSEQKPSLVYLGVRVDAESGAVRSAGGIMIEALPGCPDAELDRLTSKAEAIQQLALRLEKGEALSAVLNDILADCDMEILESYSPEFRCDCSRERLERVLISLGREELSDMIAKDHGAELRCQFCSGKYAFNEDDLRAILNEM